MLNWKELKVAIPTSEQDVKQNLYYKINHNMDFLQKNVGKKFSYKEYEIEIKGIEDDFYVDVNGTCQFSVILGDIYLLDYNEKTLRDIFSL